MKSIYIRAFLLGNLALSTMPPKEAYNKVKKKTASIHCAHQRNIDSNTAEHRDDKKGTLDNLDKTNGIITKEQKE